MLLTISTTHHPATDLGFLLHKNPNRIQTFPLNFGSAQNRSESGVIINDSMLKFHENDRREAYRQIWIDKVNKIQSNN